MDVRGRKNGKKRCPTRLRSINHNCSSQKRDYCRRWSALIDIITHAIISFYVPIALSYHKRSAKCILTEHLMWTEWSLMITLLTYAVTKMHFLHFCGISLTKAFPFLSLVVAFRFFFAARIPNTKWTAYGSINCSMKCHAACAQVPIPVTPLKWIV